MLAPMQTAPDPEWFETGILTGIGVGFVVLFLYIMLVPVVYRTTRWDPALTEPHSTRPNTMVVSVTGMVYQLGRIVWGVTTIAIVLTLIGAVVSVVV